MDHTHSIPSIQIPMETTIHAKVHPPQLPEAGGLQALSSEADLDARAAFTPTTTNASPSTTTNGTGTNIHSRNGSQTVGRKHPRSPDPEDTPYAQQGQGIMPLPLPQVTMLKQEISDPTTGTRIDTIRQHEASDPTATVRKLESDSGNTPMDEGTEDRKISSSDTNVKPSPTGDETDEDEDDEDRKLNCGQSNGATVNLSATTDVSPASPATPMEVPLLQSMHTNPFLPQYGMPMPHMPLGMHGLTAHMHGAMMMGRVESPSPTGLIHGHPHAHTLPVPHQGGLMLTPYEMDKVTENGGGSCHQCKTARSRAQLLICTRAGDRSRKRRCRKKFCQACLLRSYGVNAQHMNMSDIESWLCPACMGTCICAACGRKQPGPKPPLMPNQGMMNMGVGMGMGMGHAGPGLLNPAATGNQSSPGSGTSQSAQTTSPGSATGMNGMHMTGVGTNSNKPVSVVNSTSVSKTTGLLSHTHLAGGGPGGMFFPGPMPVPMGMGMPGVPQVPGGWSMMGPLSVGGGVPGGMPPPTQSNTPGPVQGAMGMAPVGTLPPRAVSAHVQGVKSAGANATMQVPQQQQQPQMMNFPPLSPGQGPSTQTQQQQPSQQQQGLLSLGTSSMALPFAPSIQSATAQQQQQHQHMMQQRGTLMQQQQLQSQPGNGPMQLSHTSGILLPPGSSQQLQLQHSNGMYSQPPNLSHMTAPPGGLGMLSMPNSNGALPLQPSFGPRGGVNRLASAPAAMHSPAGFAPPPHLTHSTLMQAGQYATQQQHSLPTSQSGSAHTSPQQATQSLNSHPSKSQKLSHGVIGGSNDVHGSGQGSSLATSPSLSATSAPSSVQQQIPHQLAQLSPPTTGIPSAVSPAAAGGPNGFLSQVPPLVASTPAATAVAPTTSPDTNNDSDHDAADALAFLAAAAATPGTSATPLSAPMSNGVPLPLATTTQMQQSYHQSMQMYPQQQQQQHYMSMGQPQYQQSPYAMPYDPMQASGYSHHPYGMMSMPPPMQYYHPQQMQMQWTQQSMQMQQPMQPHIQMQSPPSQMQMQQSMQQPTQQSPSISVSMAPPPATQPVRPVNSATMPVSPSVKASAAAAVAAATTAAQNATNPAGVLIPTVRRAFAPPPFKPVSSPL